MAQESNPQNMNPAPDQGSGENQSPVNFGPTVTIFFSDIRGFTEYTDAHGDEAAYRMLQHHNALLKEQIAIFGGHIVKTLGDSYMVSFDAARNAVACGIAVQRALAQYNASQQGVKIEIGIGINTGEPIREGNDLFGSSVNLASRICAVAGAGRTLVSEAVRHLVGIMKGSDYIDRGYFELKGFQEPQHLYEVDWSGVAAVRAPQVAPPSTRATAAAAVTPTPVQPVSTNRKPILVWGIVAVVLLIAGVVGGLMFLNGSKAPSETPPTDAADIATPAPEATPPPKPDVSPVTPAPPPVAETAKSEPPPTESVPTAAPIPDQAQSGGRGRLLRMDDFSDPGRGTFQNNQKGTSQLTLARGAVHSYDWDYAYGNRALVVHIKGPYPNIAERPFLAVNIPWAGKVPAEFAVEVHARATKSPAQARYGLTLAIGPGQTAVFTISPTEGQYLLAMTGAQSARGAVARGRTPAIRPADAENILRLAVRGDTARLLINGQQVDQYRNAALTQIPGIGGLQVGMTGPPADGEVEVQFTNFRALAIGQ